MKRLEFIRLVRNVVISVYGSADPNLFGSNKRRKEKAGLASEFKTMSDKTQNEIDTLKSQNPFESASAKLVMKQATRNARFLQNRNFNVLGANATPEAIIASQGATSEALGATAGQIAAGAEANKINQISALQGLKQNQLGTYGAIKGDSINERGSGWNDFFSSIGSIGQMASGVGQGANALKTAGLI